MTHVRFNRPTIDRTFNNLVDDLFGQSPVYQRNRVQTTGSVPVNIQEKEQGYQVDVIAPGYEKADFKVNVDQGILTISADKKEDASGDTPVKMVRREHRLGSFKRSFTLDEQVEASAIDAKYVNGVLSLNLPKKAEVKTAAQEINIQ